MKFTDRYKEYAGKDAQIQLDFLDSIDFAYYFYDNLTVEEIMDVIETQYDYAHPERLPQNLHGCAFNNMDASEFAEYLQERYPELYIREIVEIHHEISLRRPTWN